MSIEVRHILFSRDEIITAVQRFGRSVIANLPSTAVLALEVTGDQASPTITISVRDKAGKSAPVVVPGNDILSLLIRLCIQRKIPLPTGGTKHLFVLEDRIGLVVYLTYGEEQNWIYHIDMRLDKRIE
jgi:hypothetical protein